MPSDATVLMPAPSAPPAAVAAKRLALRIGFGVALGFVLGELFGTPLFFLPPLLAVQFLASMPQPPTLRQGLGVVVLIAVLSGLTLLLSGAFAGQPLVFLMLVGSLLFLGFLLDTAGRTMPATSLLTLSAMIPLAAVQSLAAAATLAAALVGAHAIALLTTWIAFAAFPAPPAAAPTAPTKVSEASPRRALVNTLLLFPVLLLLMIGGAMTFVVLMVIISIVRLGDRGAAHRSALGLLLGNFLGGIAATVAYGFIGLQTSIVFFLLAVLLVGLAFGARIAAGGPQAPLFIVALVTFVILLGIGVSPLPTDSGAAFTARLWNVLLAGAYAVGAVSLAGARRPAAESAGDESPGLQGRWG